MVVAIFSIAKVSLFRFLVSFLSFQIGPFVKFHQTSQKRVTFQVPQHNSVLVLCGG